MSGAINAAYVAALPIDLSLPHSRTKSSAQISIFTRDGVAATDASVFDKGVQGLQRHSISDASQCSTGSSNQALPSSLQPGRDVTWMRNGTLGSSAGCGRPGGATSQAFLMARSSLSRAFCTSWSIRIVASLSKSQFSALPLRRWYHWLRCRRLEGRPNL